MIWPSHRNDIWFPIGMIKWPSLAMVSIIRSKIETIARWQTKALRQQGFCHPFGKKMIETGHNSPPACSGWTMPFSSFRNDNFDMIYDFFIKIINIHICSSYRKVWPSNRNDRVFSRLRRVPAVWCSKYDNSGWYPLNIKQSAEESFSVWLCPSFRNDGTKMTFLFKGCGGRIFSCRSRIFCYRKNSQKNLL